MAAWPVTATLKFAPTKTWDNWHKTLSQKIEGIYTPFPPGGTDSAKVIAASVKDIQTAIKAAKDRKVRLRAAGSAWSLSRAGVTDGVMLDTSRLKHWFRIKDGNLDPGYKGDADLRTGLFFFQCGTLIAEVNKTLESEEFKRSLWTSGAANGQTIVGATATGTHGSALAFGALHDHIVAIHLLAGPDKALLLERASYPVLKPAFAAAIGAAQRRLVRGRHDVFRRDGRDPWRRDRNQEALHAARRNPCASPGRPGSAQLDRHARSGKASEAQGQGAAQLPAGGDQPAFEGCDDQRHV